MTLEKTFEQSMFGRRTKFVFKEDDFNYYVEDKSGSRQADIPYLSIDTTKGTLQSRHQWFLNAGVIWTIMGIIGLYAYGFSGSMFLFIGVGSIAYYFISQVDYTTLESAKGTVFIIQDSKHDAIIEELNESIKRVVRRDYLDINFSRTFEEEKRKYNHFLAQNLISKEEFNEKLELMEKNQEKFKSPDTAGSV